jgi:hypothetical protein
MQIKIQNMMFLKSNNWKKSANLLIRSLSDEPKSASFGFKNVKYEEKQGKGDYLFKT